MKGSKNYILDRPSVSIIEPSSDRVYHCITVSVYQWQASDFSGGVSALYFTLPHLAALYSTLLYLVFYPAVYPLCAVYYHHTPLHWCSLGGEVSQKIDRFAAAGTPARWKSIGAAVHILFLLACSVVLAVVYLRHPCIMGCILGCSVFWPDRNQ